MLKVLIRTRIQSLFSSMFRRNTGRGKPGRSALIMGLLIAVVAVPSLVFSIGAMFYLMADMMHAVGLDWLFFAIAGLVAVAFCFVGSIFATQSSLFNARDNELLLSMPIPPSYILTSRLLTLLLLNYFYSMLILIPASVVYIAVAGIGAASLIILILGVLLLPLISLALSCIFGWLIGLITARLRRKNLISTILMVGFFGVYMVFAMNLNSYISTLLENGAEISVALRRYLPPAYFFGESIAQGSWLYLFYTALICIVPMALVYFLLSKSFIHILTTQKGSVRVVYKERAMKASSTGTALFAKELNRFFRTPMYVLNCGTGAAMLLLFTGALLIKGPGIIESLVAIPAVNDMIPGALAAILGFCASLICTTAPSISLEGRNLWIIKSSPISAIQVFHAKLGVNLAVGLPASLVASLASAIVVPMSWPQRLIVILLPMTLVCSTALLGLVTNLHLPRFDWISETVVVKQSASVTISVFGAMGLVALPVILYLALLHKSMPLNLYLALWCVIYLLFCTGLYAYLRTRGERLYAKL